MSGRRNRRREGRVRRSDAAPAIRYPARPIIDALRHAMITRRSGSSTTDASLVHIWSLTGTVEDDAGNAAGFAEFSPRDVITTAGSPILDITGPMMAGIDRATAAAMIT
jgi:hypothetical protein